MQISYQQLFPTAIGPTNTVEESAEEMLFGLE